MGISGDTQCSRQRSSPCKGPEIGVCSGQEAEGRPLCLDVWVPAQVQKRSLGTQAGVRSSSVKTLDVVKGEVGWGEDELGIWDSQMQTIIYICV